jgi:predicted transposase YbfD/YdcC
MRLLSQLSAKHEHISLRMNYSFPWKMEQKVLAEKIRKKLLIESTITDETIDKASGLIGLTKNDKIILQIDRRRISISDQILLYLTGKNCP